MKRAFDSHATGSTLRGQIASWTTDEILAAVHSQLGTKDARDRFEAARHCVSRGELESLAATTLEAAGREHPRR